MEDKIWIELQVLKDASVASAEDWSGKFARDIIFTMALGGLNVFYGGLEALIGSPSARVIEAMVHEHSEEKDSSTQLTTANYGVTTTPKTEWLFAASPGGGPNQVSLHQWPREQNLLDSANIAKCRRVRTSAELDLIMEDLNTPQLEAEESRAGDTDARGDGRRRVLHQPSFREVQRADPRRCPQRPAGRQRQDAVPEDLPRHPIRDNHPRQQLWPPELPHQTWKGGDGVPEFLW